MKKFIVGIVVLSFCVGASLCFAEEGIPNMVGTWTTKTEGGAVSKKGEGAKSHHSGDFTALTAEVVVTKQQGRVFHGTFTSKKATEAFVGVISMDNESVYSADEDGFFEGKIVSTNKVNLLYRHTTPADTVVAVGTWTRKK